MERDVWEDITLDEQSKQFLLELLDTPSPSGFEMEIQKKWIQHVKPYVESIETDLAGNAIASLNKDADFKVLLAGHCDEIGFLVRRIDDRGFIYVEKLGGISHKPAIGMKVQFLGKKPITGVIGVNAEHHGGMKDEFKFHDLFIDIGAKSKREAQEYVAIGDVAVYQRNPELLLNERIAGRGLDNRTGAFIVAEVMKRLSKQPLNVGVFGVSTVNEETNMGGAYFAGANLEPSMAIALDVTFATDYPGVDRAQYGEVDIEKGPVLAKGAPINWKINKWLEQAAERLKISLQYELTPRRTGTDADQIRLTGKGVPVALVSLPLRYMHSPVETASLQDIEKEIQLLVDFISHLTGNEDLKPVSE